LRIGPEWRLDSNAVCSLLPVYSGFYKTALVEQHGVARQVAPS